MAIDGYLNKFSKLFLIISIITIIFIFCGTFQGAPRSVSKVNEKYDPSFVLQKTKEFMDRNVDENDPELIQFVKEIILPPSPYEYNFAKPKSPGVDYSQEGQSKYIDELLNQRTNGFYIEAGAFDGESISNSLFFELTRQWKGILIEPIFFDSVKSKCRKAYALNACISKSKPFIAKFLIGGSLSGNDQAMNANHKERLRNETKQEVYKNVPCFSLNTIMKAIGVSKVDYFSLDVEGGEIDVLNAIDFNALNIESFSIEHNGRSDDIKKMREIFGSLKLVDQATYNETRINAQDIFFKKV